VQDGNDRLTAKELADRLGGRREGNYYKAHCPAHDDKESSLAISEKNGKVLFKCHAGCTQDVVLDRPSSDVHRAVSVEQ